MQQPPHVRACSLPGCTLLLAALLLPRREVAATLMHDGVVAGQVLINLQRSQMLVLLSASGQKSDWCAHSGGFVAVACVALQAGF
jgi:hypothetical protein